MSLNLLVRLITPEAKCPTKANEHALGFDLYSAETVKIPARYHILVGTRISVELPEGYGAIIFDRSSVGSKGVHRHGGVIDNDYRGEIFVDMWNISRQQYEVHQGDRIAQLVLIPSPMCEAKVVDSLTATLRDTKGYGSTGR